MWTVNDLVLAFVVCIAIYAWATSAPAKRLGAWLWGAVLSMVSPTARADYVAQPEPYPANVADIDTDTTRGIPAPILTDEQLTRLLARRKTVDTLSANAIYSIVGGNRNQVLAWIREERATTVAEQPMHVTPIVGRTTSAQFHDEDLAYTKPPQ